MSNVYAVIMAGGAGTRFWPASRVARPKQLLPLAGDPNESLLAATVRRIAPLIPAERVYIATGAHLVEGTAQSVPSIPRAQLLVEPVPRNTAPCIGWATATIARRDPDALIAVLPSDHFIVDEVAFRRVLESALASANSGSVTTIGIVPTRPETGYGYIEIGDELRPGTFSVARFIEKPDKSRAEIYARGGRHLWNAGMFFFRASAMILAIRKHLPDLATGLERLDRAAAAGTESAELERVFPSLLSISIDHGVLEKATGLSVVPGDFGWSDVGSWESAWELATKDTDGNAAPDGTILVASKGNLVGNLGRESGRKVIALVGIQDLVVVDTDDALLVMPRNRAQDVRAVVEALRKTKRDHLL